jgi:hypothetical protein
MRGLPGRLHGPGGHATLDPATGDEARLTRGPEINGQTPVPGPHAPEIVRQTIRDVAGAWTGPPVIVQINGPAGGRWLLGDGTPIVTISSDPLCYVRHVTARASGATEAE